jgi:nitroreductase
MLANFVALSNTDPFGNSARFELVSANENDRRALRGLGTYGFIKGATGFIVGAIEKNTDNLEGYGYLLEGIILYATELGLGTCWLGGTFTKSSFARKIRTREDELVPAVASVGYIAKKPRRIETLLRGRGGYERRLPWEQLFFDNNFAVPLKRESTNGYNQVLEMVRLSPSASNRQPWRIVKEGRNFHFYLQRTPGYRQSLFVRLTTIADLQRIDIGIAMNHFELMARDLNLEGCWEVNEPSIEKTDELTEYTVSWVI